MYSIREQQPVVARSKGEGDGNQCPRLFTTEMSQTNDPESHPEVDTPKRWSYSDQGASAATEELWPTTSEY